MSKIRIIPRLDIKGPNVVKGIKFEGLRIVGRPDELARKYYQQGADELLYIDTVASLYGRNNLTEIVEKAASEIFIPLTVGGGIRSVEDTRSLIKSGADRVAINTAAVKTPSLLTNIATTFGSQVLVASLQIKKKDNGSWEIYTDNGRERSGLDAAEWARKVEEFGAGEILITSVDKDGTEEGFELDFIECVKKTASIPVIAGGGAGSMDHIVNVVQNFGVDAVAVASQFHYERLQIGEVKSKLKQTGAAIAEH